MYRVKAIIAHKVYDTHYQYVDKVFDSLDSAKAWIASAEGREFEQNVMVYIDVNDYLQGYHLERLEAECSE